jgi:hypothetical protein
VNRAHSRHDIQAQPVITKLEPGAANTHYLEQCSSAGDQCPLLTMQDRTVSYDLLSLLCIGVKPFRIEDLHIMVLVCVFPYACNHAWKSRDANPCAHLSPVA